VVLSHCIRLVPAPSQEEYFVRACGVARFAYNWALAESKRQREAGLKPSQIALRKQLNEMKAQHSSSRLDEVYERDLAPKQKGDETGV
jgi:putative transposase